MKKGQVLTGLIISLIAVGWTQALGTGYNLNWSYETGGWVRGAAVSGDGNYAAAGSQDTRIYLFNKTGGVLWSYPTRSFVSSVALSNDGSLLAAGSDDTNLYFFDRHGILWFNDEPDKGVEIVSISDDGAYVAASADDTVYLFHNLNDVGVFLWKFPISGVVHRLYISPTGEYVAAQSRDRNAYFLDRDGELLWSKDLETVPLSKTVPDSDPVLAAFSRFNTIFVFNKNGTLRWTTDVPGGVEDISIIGSGSRIAVHTGDGEIRMYTNDGNQTSVLEVNGSIRRPSLSDDASYIAAGFDSPDSNLYFYSLAAVEPREPNATEPEIVVLANSIDLGMAADFIGYLELNGFRVVHANATTFEQYKRDPLIIILGGPDAPEGVGGLVGVALSEWEEGQIRAEGSRKLYVKSDVWASGQKVLVIAGADRERTRVAHEENRAQVISELGL